LIELLRKSFPQKKVLDAAVNALIINPLQGEVKKGDLVGV